MEAYRRLAAVAGPADVDDIRAEWHDRYGPPPSPAAALLDVARLRAECVRTGVRSVSVQRGIARIRGLELRESQKIRLRRLVPGAVAKVDGETAIPVSGDSAAVCATLVELLEELIPAEAAAPLASAAP
jgi:transcription-repair coupling factor (superfamily II helicase)